MASTCNVHLRIISGHELPKTDIFSQIDPYVVVSYGGVIIGRTVTRDNNPNPVWQEDFFFEAEEDECGLHGVVTLDLYDEEVARDEHVGSIALDLQSLGADTLMDPVELPVAFHQDKRGQKLSRNARRARLAVQVVALGKSFSAYASELGEAEQARVDEASRAFLVPLPDTEGGVWVGMRFLPRATHLLLVSTRDPKSEANPVMSYDWSYSAGPSLRLERWVYRKPVKLMGLKVWSELRATNVPITAKLSKIRILEREHRLVDTLDPADVLVAHNYMIGMPFLAAVKELSKHGAHVDTAAQSIWLRMDSNQPQPAQLLQLDYGPGHLARVAAAAATATTAPTGGGSDAAAKRDALKYPALCVCSTTSELNKGYELAFFGGGGRGNAAPMVTVSETFRRPVQVLGGMYDVVQTLELRDAFQGDTLEEVALGCYEMVRPSRTWRLGKVFEAALAADFEFEEGWEGDGGVGDGGGGGDGAGAFGYVRGWFACLPLSCFAKPRADTYLEEQGRSESYGGGGTSRRGRGGATTADRKAATDDGYGHGQEYSRRDDVGRRADSASRPRGPSGPGGGTSLRSAGGGGGGSSRAVSGAGGGGGGGDKLTASEARRRGAGASPPPRLPNGSNRNASSVGSSSGRSTALPTYNNSRTVKGSGAPSRAGPGVGSARRGPARRRQSSEEEDD